MPILLNIGIYLLLFFILWLGSGLIVSSVDAYTKRFRLSQFMVSFFILGIMTSIPEFSVGLASVFENKPEIFVGNLFGGVVIIFLLIIPLLAIIGNGIRINHDYSQDKILITLGVIIAPSVLVLDKKVSNFEGLVLIFLYVLLFFILQKKNGIMGMFTKHTKIIKKFTGVVLIKILFGIIIVSISSHFILQKTIYFSQLIGIAPFYMSLIVLSLGTNLPELMLAIRSVIQGKKDIAFGDYMGSATSNTLLFGVFTLFNRGGSFQVDNFLKTFVFILVGLSLFFIFSRTKKDISRTEGFILLSLYILFIIIELNGKIII